MMEYIERAAAMESIIGLTIVDPAVAQYANAVYYNLQNLPAADVVEARHGHWIGEIDDRDGHIWMECSECHKIRIVDDFCGACGARMEKEDEHEEV